MKKNTPCNVSAEIELDSALEKLQFYSAGNFYNYNNVVSVRARFNIHKSKMELVKLLVKKVSNALYAKMVIEHLKGTSHNLDKLCMDIGEIQRLIKQVSGNHNPTKAKEKEFQLASTEGNINICGLCGNCKKRCRYCNKTSPHLKSKNNGGCDNTCNRCGMKGHIKSECWKKNHNKTHQ